MVWGERAWSGLGWGQCPCVSRHERRGARRGSANGKRVLGLAASLVKRKSSPFHFHSTLPRTPVRERPSAASSHTLHLNEAGRGWLKAAGWVSLFCDGGRWRERRLFLALPAPAIATPAPLPPRPATGALPRPPRSRRAYAKSCSWPLAGCGARAGARAAVAGEQKGGGPLPPPFLFCGGGQGATTPAPASPATPPRRPSGSLPGVAGRGWSSLVGGRVAWTGCRRRAVAARACFAFTPPHLRSCVSSPWDDATPSRAPRPHVTSPPPLALPSRPHLPAPALGGGHASYPRALRPTLTLSCPPPPLSHPRSQPPARPLCRLRSADHARRPVLPARGEAAFRQQQGRVRHLPDYNEGIQSAKVRRVVWGGRGNVCPRLGRVGSPSKRQQSPRARARSLNLTTLLLPPPSLPSINTEGVIQRVKDLFHGDRELILGFNTFLPKVKKGRRGEGERGREGWPWE